MGHVANVAGGWVGVFSLAMRGQPGPAEVPSGAEVRWSLERVVGCRRVSTIQEDT